MKFISHILMVSLAVLACSPYVCPEQAPLEVAWSAQISRGVSRIDVFALGQNRYEMVYAIAFDPRRSVIYVFDLDGNKMDEIGVSMQGTQEGGSERVEFVAAYDIDRDGLLDIFFGTSLQAPGASINRMYRMERFHDAGLERMSNRIVWIIRDAGPVTSLAFMDMLQNGEYEIITSSLNNRIKVDDALARRLYDLDLETNIWDVHPIFPARRRGQGMEDVRFLAAVHSGMMLIGYDGEIISHFGEGYTFRKVHSVDFFGEDERFYLGIYDGGFVSYDIQGAGKWSFQRNNIADIDVTTIFEQEHPHVVVGADKWLIFYNYAGRVKYIHELESEILAVREYETQTGKFLFVGTKDGILALKVNESVVKAELARMAYEKAMEHYLAGEYEISLNLSNISRQIYREIMDLDNEPEARRLMWMSQAHIDAHSYLEMSRFHESQREYNLSSEYAMKALMLYDEIGYETGIDKGHGEIERLRALAKELREQVIAQKDKLRADSIYSQSEELFMRGQYAKSKALAEQALNIYLELGDEARTSLAEKLIRMNEEFIVPPTTTTIIIPTTTTMKSKQVTEEDIIFYASIAGIISVIAYLASKYFRRG